MKKKKISWLIEIGMNFANVFLKSVDLKHVRNYRPELYSLRSRSFLRRPVVVYVSLPRTQHCIRRHSKRPCLFLTPLACIPSPRPTVHIEHWSFDIPGFQGDFVQLPSIRVKCQGSHGCARELPEPEQEQPRDSNNICTHIYIYPDTNYRYTRNNIVRISFSRRNYIRIVAATDFTRISSSQKISI